MGVERWCEVERERSQGGGEGLTDYADIHTGREGGYIKRAPTSQSVYASSGSYSTPSLKKILAGHILTFGTSY